VGAGKRILPGLPGLTGEGHGGGEEEEKETSLVDKGAKACLMPLIGWGPHGCPQIGRRFKRWCRHVACGVRAPHRLHRSTLLFVSCSGPRIAYINAAGQIGARSLRQAKHKTKTVLPPRPCLMALRCVAVIRSAHRVHQRGGPDRRAWPERGDTGGPAGGGGAR
jgi:hypothetical protein